MTPLTAQFGNLRALIQKPPSTASWYRLCDMLDQWSDAEHLQHVVLPYAQDILDRTWPDLMRQAPLSWLARLLKGDEQVQGFELVRRIGHTQHYVSDEPCIATFPTTPTEDLCALLNHPQLAHVTQLNLRNLPMHGDRLVQTLAQSKLITELRFLNLGGTQCMSKTLHTLWESPIVDTIENLELWSMGLEDEDIRALASSPRLKRLQRLELGNNNIGPQGAHALTHASHIEALTHLYLWNNHNIGDEGIQALLDAPNTTHLEVLELQQCGIGPDGAHALGTTTQLHRIKELAISENSIKDEGAGALLCSTTLPTLEILRATNIATSMGYLDEHLPTLHTNTLKSLYLGGINSPINATSVRALGAAQQLDGLEELCISNMSCTQESLRALARAPWFAALHTLKLFGRFHWGDEPQFSLASLLKNVPWTHLEHMSVAGLDLTAEDCLALAQNTSLGALKHLRLFREEHIKGHIGALMSSNSMQLEHLDLQHCRLSQQDVEAIAQSAQAQTLHTLDLSHNHLSTQSIAALAQSDNLGNLVTLRLRSCDLNAECLWLLAKSTSFKTLRVLELDDALPQRGFEFLAHTPHLHPDVRVPFEHLLRLRT